jgi:hypothetical protein
MKTNCVRLQLEIVLAYNTSFDSIPLCVGTPEAYQDAICEVLQRHIVARNETKMVITTSALHMSARLDFRKGGCSSAPLPGVARADPQSTKASPPRRASRSKKART